MPSLRSTTHSCARRVPLQLAVPVWPGSPSSFSTRATASTSTAPASSARSGWLADVEPVVVPVRLGDQLNVDDLAEADGLLVGGGLTPEYAASLVPVRDDLIRWLVERGAPYAGFSAGAAIAAAHAVVGGWRHHGRPICPEHAGEDLEEVAVVAGLGLVPFTVEVHADAWETTPRLRAAIADLGEGHVGYALDEDTALIVQGDKLTTIGRGRAARIVG